MRCSKQDYNLDLLISGNHIQIYDIDGSVQDCGDSSH